MLVVFEDNEEASISQILKSVYAGTNTKIEFTGGNKNLLVKTLNGDFDKEDMVIIYVDVVPDNATTLGVLRKLVAYTNSKENLHVIPILCIEYYFALAYKEHVLGDCLTVMNNHGSAYRESEVCTGRLKKYLQKKNITIEKYFKAIVAYRMRMCMSGERWVRQEKNIQRNVFYLVDCCCNTSSIECKEMCLCEKGCRVIVELPAFIEGKTTDYLRTSNIDMFTAVQCAIEEYNNFAKELHKSGYTLRMTLLECCWDNEKMTESLLLK